MERGGHAPRALEAFIDDAVRAGDDPALVARALVRQSRLYRRACEWELATAYARRAEEMAVEARLPEVRADALMAEGNALMCSGGFDEALAVYTRLARVTMDDRQRGNAMQNVGSIHAQRGEYAVARTSFESSRVLFRQAGYELGEAIAMNNLGRLALDTGDHAAAGPMLQGALLGARAAEDTDLAALALLNLAQLHVAQGELASATTLVAGANEHFLASENRWRQVECLCVLADIADAGGEHEAARRHLERGRELARAIDARVELARIEMRLRGE